MSLPPRDACVSRTGLPRAHRPRSGNQPARLEVVVEPDRAFAGDAIALEFGDTSPRFGGVDQPTFDDSAQDAGSHACLHLGKRRRVEFEGGMKAGARRRFAGVQ